MEIGNRYYREYMINSGWGVMLGHDSVYASSKKAAKKIRTYNMYVNSFDYIVKVKKEHITLSDDELYDIYSKGSEEKKRVWQKLVNMFMKWR